MVTLRRGKWINKKIKNFLLLKFLDTWADEMDIHSFRLVTKELWSKVKDACVEHDKADYIYAQGGFEISIGTNVSLFYDSAMEWYDKVTTRVITKQEAITLIDLFGKDIYRDGEGQECLSFSELKPCLWRGTNECIIAKELAELEINTTHYLTGMYYDYHK